MSETDGDRAAPDQPATERPRNRDETSRTDIQGDSLETERAASSRTLSALVDGCYYTIPAKAQKGAPLLVGCHGYGETAREMLAAMVAIPGIEHWTICSVEALHPFYRRSTGEVVRSWMTSEGRDRAIVGNVNYVRSVIEAVRLDDQATGPLAFIGFSQGVAMAWRAAMRCGWPAHAMIAVAGDVPADAVTPPPYGLPDVLIARGASDTWYTEEKLEADLERLAPLRAASPSARVETLVYDAGHVWHDDVYQAAGRLLERVRDGASV